MFESGDKIIIIQMQADIIGTNTNNNVNFGNINTIASTGMYKIATKGMYLLKIYVNNGQIIKKLMVRR